MGHTWPLISYKLRFFFGPALRGRFGPLVYALLILAFVPSGYGLGFILGSALQSAPPEVALETLATPLALFLTFGLLYSLGTGVTAHPSEFAFFMTAPLRPREYLIVDIIFQFIALLAVGGLALFVATIAVVQAVGRPLATVVPLLAALLPFELVILLVSQILVILRVRFPKAPIRTMTLVLIALSLLPSISLAGADLGVDFNALPFPSMAFARLGYGILFGVGIDAVALGAAIAYVGLVGLAWLAVSNAYIFHGIRPTLSVGFGQVDMSVRLESQARMIGTLGGLTTRLRFRAERGGFTSLMTRLHLVRFWRDGSLLFVALFAGITLLPTALSGGLAQGNVFVAQMGMILIAILAMNWSFYERENLWLVLSSSGSPGSYFRGLLLSLVAVGFAITLVYLVGLAAFSRMSVTIGEAAFPLVGTVVGAFVATAILTRVKLKAASFSPAIFGILLAVTLTGLLGGVLAQAIVQLVPGVTSLGQALRGLVLVTLVTALTAVALWTVARLAAGFRL